MGEVKSLGGPRRQCQWATWGSAMTTPPSHLVEATLGAGLQPSLRGQNRGIGTLIAAQECPRIMYTSSNHPAGRKSFRLFVVTSPLEKMGIWLSLLNKGWEVGWGWVGGGVLITTLANFQNSAGSTRVKDKSQLLIYTKLRPHSLERFFPWVFLLLLPAESPGLLISYVPSANVHS